ncbi:MAG: hypothetical protein AB7F64_06645, partial [Gammaproteobacteria bacterium]
MNNHITFLTYVKNRLNEAIAAQHNDLSRLESDNATDDPARKIIKENLLPKIDTQITKISSTTGEKQATLQQAAQFYRNNIVAEIDKLKLKRYKKIFFEDGPTFLGTQIASANSDIQDKFTELQAQEAVSSQVDTLAQQKADVLVAAAHQERDAERAEKEAKAKEAEEARAREEQAKQREAAERAEKEAKAKEAEEARAREEQAKQREATERAEKEAKAKEAEEARAREEQAKQREATERAAKEAKAKEAEEARAREEQAKQREATERAAKEAKAKESEEARAR